MTTQDVLIKNARLATGVPASVFVRNGRIAKVGPDVSAADAETIDAEGRTLLPGVVDLHVHARFPDGEHKEDYAHLIPACLAGGVTSIAVMPNTTPPLETAEAMDANIHAAQAVEKDFSVHVNVGLSGLDGKRLANVLDHPAVAGAKAYLSDFARNFERLRDLAQAIADKDRILMVHAQDPILIEKNRSGRESAGAAPHPRNHALIQDAACEVAAVRRMTRLAEETGCRVHLCHISSMDGFREAARGRDRTRKITIETCPPYWTVDASMLERNDGARFVVNPSLREAKHRDWIRTHALPALADIVASDHAPHTLDEKARPYPSCPSGMPGVQTLLPLLLDVVAEGNLSLPTAQALACEDPARLMGWSTKGRIEPGADADLVLVEFGGPWELRDEDMRSKCGWTAFRGLKVRARVVRTFLRGRTVYQCS